MWHDYRRFMGKVVHNELGLWDLNGMKIRELT